MTQNETAKTVYWIDNTLYLNITNLCPNNCYFCFKHYKRGVGGFNLKLAQEPSVEQIKAELSEMLHMRNWSEIAFCGFGEPTARLDVLLTIARWIRQHYGRPVQIRVDTNGQGYRLNLGRDVAAELKSAGVDRVSVSLNAQNKETYNEICKPTFVDAYESVLDFITKAKTVLAVEATVVRISEIDVFEAKAVAEKLGVDFRVREYIPCFY
jgi:TatD family-associated radical SAM protein